MTNELMTTDERLRSLIITRMLIQAGSGGGKSWAIRYLAEQFCKRVQQFIFDWEGEFITLREKFSFALVGRGEGADVQLVVDHAATYAEKLYFSGMSVIFDLSDLGHKDRLKFVDRFLRKLMSFPLDKYHPLLIFLDEAHKYCPQVRQPGDAADAVIDIATMGRKRDIGLVLATQRISKLHKDAAAECLNKLIGRTGQDVDQVRALDELGDKAITKKHLRQLAPGNFYCFGPALQDEVTLVHIGAIASHHGKPPAGWKIPVPADLKDMVGELADLPQEAQQLADDINALHKETQRLSREKAHLELRIQEFERLKLKPLKAGEVLEKMKEVARGELKDQFDEATRQIAVADARMKEYEKGLAKFAVVQNQLVAARKRYQRAESLIERLGNFIGNFFRKFPGAAFLGIQAAIIYNEKGEPVKQEDFAPHAEGWEMKGKKLEYPVMKTGYQERKNGDGEAAHLEKMPLGPVEIIPDALPVQNFVPVEAIQWGRQEKRILAFLQDWKRTFTKFQIAYATGYSDKSGGFEDALRKLEKNALICKTKPGGYSPNPEKGTEIMVITGHPKKVKNLTVGTYSLHFDPQTHKILDFLNTQPHRYYSKEEIAQATGYSVKSGGFEDSLRDLIKLDMAYKDDNGKYSLAHDLR